MIYGMEVATEFYRIIKLYELYRLLERKIILVYN